MYLRKTNRLPRQALSAWTCLAILVAFCGGGCFHAVEEIHPPSESETSPSDSTVTTADGTLSSATPVPSETDWPWWRGEIRDNHATGPVPPTTWSETENVLWKASVPGRAHSSPILWGQHLWVTNAEETTEEQTLLCFDRETGNELWKTVIHTGGWPRIHHKNSQASATPVCDGEQVYTVFAVNDAIWVSAVDLKGSILWQTEAGPFLAPHGYGSSPVLYQSFIIVMSDNKNGGFVAALDRHSGEIAWRVRRDRDDSYATPVVAHVAGKDQLLISGQNKVISYDPLSGGEIWSCRGPTDATANSMAFTDELVFATGGYPQQNVMAIRADGAGDVTQTHIAWQNSFKLYVPSPLVIDDRLLAVGDEGVASCYSIPDGKLLWKKRMGNSSFSASPVLIDDLVYIPDERGKMYVFRATAKDLEKVAENNLADGGMASPVIAGGRLYLRTAQSLYCIGDREEANGESGPESETEN